MTTAMWEHQQAIFQRLVAAGIAGGRILDDIPGSGATDFPYVQIGESTAAEQDVDGSDGTEETMTLHVWSRHEGQKEVKEIMSAIQAELHNTTLAVAGRTALVWWAGSFTRNDPDGETRQGIIQLRIISRT